MGSIAEVVVLGVEGMNIGRVEGPWLVGARELWIKTFWSLESVSVPLLACISGLPSSKSRPFEGASIDCRDPKE